MQALFTLLKVIITEVLYMGDSLVFNNHVQNKIILNFKGDHRVCSGQGPGVDRARCKKLPALAMLCTGYVKL